MPEHLLALVFSHVLLDAARQPYKWEPSWRSTTAQARQDPFHRDTAAIRQAIVLAATCRQWRSAAAQAIQALQLGLYPRYKVHVPECLSALLAELFHSCSSVSLRSRLLAAPTAARFLELTQPNQLVILSIRDCHLGAVGATLASCNSVLALTCERSNLPPAWPPNLQRLTVRPGPYASSASASALLLSLQGLPSLVSLTLQCYPPTAPALADPACFQSLPSLQQLTIDLRTPSWANAPAQAFDLRALPAACVRGAILCLQACLTWSGDPAARLRLYTAVAECSVQRLQICVEIGSHSTAAVLAPAERQLLATVSCSLLVLHICTEGGSTQQPLALLDAQAPKVYCELQCGSEDDTVAWSVLAARPGVFVLSTTNCSLVISGCHGDLPPFAAGWALVLKQRHPAFPARVQGLLLSNFVLGPKGHLVWRNSRVSDHCLEEAYSQLEAAGRCTAMSVSQRSESE